MIEQSRQAIEQAQSKAGHIPDERKFALEDPVRQRHPAETDEDLEETPLLSQEPPIQTRRPGASAAALAAAAAAGVTSVGIAASTLSDPPIQVRRPGNKTEDPAPPIAPVTPVTPVTPTPKTDNSPDTVDVQQVAPRGKGMLRPSFKMGGTEEIHSIPISVQNSEWAEFDFVKPIDIQNLIEVSNKQGERVRFREPLFRPKTQAPLAPPTLASYVAMMSSMDGAIQLTQPFQPKFDRAEMGRDIQLTATYNHSVFPSNFDNLTLYNPI